MHRPDSYPGEPPVERGAHPIDGFIYRHMTTIIAARREGESVRDPDSEVARRSAELADSLHYLGIHPQRVRIGSAKAHMDFAQMASTIRRSKPEDFGAEV